MNAELWDLLRTEGLMGASITGDDAREIVERVERLEAALREIKGESEAFQEYEHAAPDTFQRITILARAALTEPVTP